MTSCVLVVVGNKAERDQYVDSLRHEGMAAIGAASSEEVQGFLRGIVPAVVLIELAGNGSSEELGLVQLVRQRTGSKAKIAVMSASTTDDVIARSLSAGADVFVAKPGVPVNVACEVAKMLSLP